MQEYRLIVITIAGTAFGFATASTAGATSITVDQGNLRTYSGGKPDPGLHTSQSVGVPNSGGAQWMPQLREHDYVTLGPELALAGLCTFAVVKRL
jgi:hypothetical protein